MLSDCILTAIDKTVPIFKSHDNTQQFLNPLIKTLQQEKSKALSIIKKDNRMEIQLTPYNMNFLKIKLKLIKKLINDNITIQVNKNMINKMSKYNTKNTEFMFREFKTSRTCIKSLKIPQNEDLLLENANIDKESLEVVGNEYKVEKSDQVINLIGSYLELVHSKKDIDPNNHLYLKVNDSFNGLLRLKADHEENHLTITNFSCQKRANDLTDSQTDNYFITLDLLCYTFNKIKNKLSFGLDGVPNIVLKHLPITIIGNYCTLFNNILNNSYFPMSWKTAKVVVIPKKDKDIRILKNLVR